MYWYSTLLSLLLLFAAAASTIVAHTAWKKRPVPGSIAFAITMLSITQWSLAFLAQMVSADFADKVAWATFQYLGLLILPIAWITFTFQYTGRGQLLTPLNLTSLSLIPAISFFLILTNDAHHLFWQNLGQNTMNGVAFLTITPAFWYWINAGFLYLCFLVGSLLLLTSQRYEISSLSPTQAWFLLFGLLLPWFGFALQLIGFNTIGLMPLAFALSGLIVAHYALRFYFPIRTPVANQALLNSLGDGLLVLDPSLTIVDANVAAETILQRPLTSFLGKPLATIWPELATQYPHVTQRSLDIAYNGPKGIQFYEVSASTLLDWRKTPSVHLLMLHDVTQRKQQETLREELTHSLVHDLRSPISNSLFALQMLKSSLTEETASADNYDLVDLTFANTEKVLNLVNNILDVARMENSQLPVKCTAVSLNHLVTKVVRGHLAHAQEKQIQLYQKLPQDLPPAWADAELLERVLQNLVDNSLKFSAPGGIVSISAVAVPDKQTNINRLEVSVSDTGPGIAPDLVSSIFDKFVTGEGKESGNGLGLAFCQMALTAHGEKIWVENNKGAGVTFTFSLTAVPARHKPSEMETAVAHPTALHPDQHLIHKPQAGRNSRPTSSNTPSRRPFPHEFA